MQKVGGVSFSESDLEPWSKLPLGKIFLLDGIRY